MDNELLKYLKNGKVNIPSIDKKDTNLFKYFFKIKSHDSIQKEVLFSKLGTQFGFNAVQYYPLVIGENEGVICKKWSDTKLLDESTFLIIDDLYSHYNKEKLNPTFNQQFKRLLNINKCFESVSSIKQILDTEVVLSKYFSKSALAETIKLSVFDYIFMQTDRHSGNIAHHVNQDNIYNSLVLFDNEYSLLTLSHNISSLSNIELSDEITYKKSFASLAFGAFIPNEYRHDYLFSFGVLRSRINENTIQDVKKSIRSIDINKSINEIEDETGGFKIDPKIGYVAEKIFTENAEDILNCI